MDITTVINGLNNYAVDTEHLASDRTVRFDQEFNTITTTKSALCANWWKSLLSCLSCVLPFLSPDPRLSSIIDRATVITTIRDSIPSFADLKQFDLTTLRTAKTGLERLRVHVKDQGVLMDAAHAIQTRITQLEAATQSKKTRQSQPEPSSTKTSMPTAVPRTATATAASVSTCTTNPQLQKLAQYLENLRSSDSSRFDTTMRTFTARYAEIRKNPTKDTITQFKLDFTKAFQGEFIIARKALEKTSPTSSSSTADSDLLIPDPSPSRESPPLDGEGTVPSGTLVYDTENLTGAQIRGLLGVGFKQHLLPGKPSDDETLERGQIRIYRNGRNLEIHAAIFSKPMVLTPSSAGYANVTQRLKGFGVTA